MMNIEKRKGFAEIYLITSPSGKRYVGKANCVSSKGRLHGTSGRWKGHIIDSRAKDGGRCRLLNEEIRMYNETAFQVIPILTCKMKETSRYEKMFIQEFDTLHQNNPMGLNILQGGNCGPLPESVRNRMSQNRRIKPCFSKPHTAKTKQQISESLIDKVVRYDHSGNLLPKYMKYVVWKDRRGYQIVNHPQCKCKYFVSSQEDIEALKARCLEFLRKITPS